MTPPDAPIPAFDIRNARINDLPQIATIERNVFPSDRLSLRQMRYHLRNPRAIFLACEQDGRIVGYVLAFQRSGAPGRIYSLAVSGEFQGKGFGKRLMESALNALKTRGVARAVLEVRKSDEKTRALYRHFGFRDERELPGYYGDGADGVRMSIELESA